MAPVQLYVYDLSKGLAKSMSLMLTGKQIDGIWHTSVVVFGREIFFGQGILEAKPGTTHHGQPLQIIDCGETEIDHSTFQEYLSSLAEMYTPSAYHLIEFNCNHFTADLVGFLTGGSIPSWISGLPAEFLATPFGQAMKPQIDAMFRRTAPSEHLVNPSAAGSSRLALPTPPESGTSTPTPSSILSSIASQATAGPTPAATPPKPSPATSPLTLVSSMSHYDSILKSHTAVIVNFTNTPGCPPCRAIKPVYESLAAEISIGYPGKSISFIEIELGIGEGQSIASKAGVRATPTFQFFKDGKKVDEMKGATKSSLENGVAKFLEEVYPRHKHRKVYMPSIEGIHISAITSGAIPKYPALLAKLEEFAGNGTENLKVLKEEVVPLLEGKAVSDQQLKEILIRWTSSTQESLRSLKPEQTFPIIDLWRVGLLNPKIATQLALALSPSDISTDLNPLTPILTLASSTLSSQGNTTPKPFLLTTLRLLTNLIASSPLANLVLATPHPSPILSKLQEQTIQILVDSLLHPEPTVRSAAAGVAVNVAGWRHRMSKEVGIQPEDGNEAEWDVNLISALIESIGKEEDEDVAHRLLVAFTLSVWLSPGYADTLQSLLEVLGAKTTIQTKAKSWKKKEVKKLADEVVLKLI